MLRAMRSDPDGLPQVARSARALGVRVPTDVLLDGDDVLPGRGMSVFVGTIEEISNHPDTPLHRWPKSLGGDSSDPLFRFVGQLPAELALVATPPPPFHSEVSPAMRCPLAAYEASIVATRTLWERV
jgi:hypothetical protein